MSDSVLSNEPAGDSDSAEVGGIDSAVIIQQITDELNADVFLFSGPIERAQAATFIDVAERVERRENVALVLCTFGGDADAAFIIARYLKRFYKKFTLYVYGYCKSAGTLIAIGADEIVMSHRGEFGPLDVQLLKSDELIFRSSGLDIQQALEFLGEQAFSVFDRHFIGIIKKGGGAITTKTAADIASTISVGMFSPITAQIDPLRVGEMQRAVNIAHQYGIRLNKDHAIVNKLVTGYPTHSFVIDYQEASDLFGNVRGPNETEQALEQILQAVEGEIGRKWMLNPHKSGMVIHINPAQEQKDESEQEVEAVEMPLADSGGGSEVVNNPESNGSDSRKDGGGTERSVKAEQAAPNGAAGVPLEEGGRQ
jgi:hypothetical protein